MTAPLQDATQQLVERFRFVLSEVMDQFEHPRDAVTAAMSAGIVFAGVQAGTLIALGDIADDAVLIVSLYMSDQKGIAEKVARILNKHWDDEGDDR